MVFHSEYSSFRQGNGGASAKEYSSGYFPTPRQQTENNGGCTAFISHNSHGIWRIELKQPVSTSLTESEQVKYIRQSGILAECNDALAMMYGHSSEEEMLRFAPDNFPADLFTGDENQILQFVRSNYHLDGVESVRVGANGETHYFSTDFFGIVKNRRLTQIWGLQREITAEKEAEQHQQETVELYQAVVDSLSAHIAVLDKNGKIIATNEAWEKFSRENGGNRKAGVGADYLGSSCLTNNTDERFQETYRGIRDVLDGKSDYFSLEYPCHQPEGEERWFLLHVTPLAKGGAVVSHLNVTKRRKAEDELKKTVEELKAAVEETAAANRLKDEFLSTVSHELRTPLTSMLGWTRMLRSGNLDEKATSHALDTIERNTLSQSRLIDDLLDVSRIITGRLRVEMHPTKLLSVIDEALEQVRPTAAMKNIELELSKEIEDVSISADSRRIQQVVSNLLTNAVKFTPRGGKVAVRVSRNGANAEISVKDDGIGINPEFLPHIFERFRQADGTSTRKHGGLGLGLTIVKCLTELHGGEVEALSAGAGQGAEFKIRLPILGLKNKSPEEIEKNAMMNGQAKSAVAGRLDEVKLLIVDDDNDNLELLTLLFETLGAEVETAGSVKEALGKFQTRPPDLLISDIGMPEEDGYALIEKIRAMPNGHSQIPAIALTAYAKNEDRLLALRKGFHRHIKKPVEPQELARQVSEMLAERN